MIGNPLRMVPADATTTPAARSSSLSDVNFIYAPRGLNEPVICMFSSFKTISVPQSSDNMRESMLGVRMT